MSELQTIQTALERAARRRRWARALRGLWLGLLVGAIISLLMAGAYHLFPLPLWTARAGALAPFPCLLAGMLLGGWRKPGLKEVARWVDRRRQLQERLSTALEVSADPNAGAWGDLVVADAAQHAKALDPRELLAFSLTKTTRWALVVLVLVAGLGFVPEYRSKTFLQKKSDEANIKEAGRQLADLTRHNLEKRTPVFEPTQKAMEAAINLGNEFSKKTLTRSDALKDLANVAEQLKDLRNQLKDLSRDPTLKRLEQAARSASGGDAQTAASMQKQIESLQKQLGTPTGNPDAIDKLKKQLEKIEEAAKSLAGNNSPGADAERQKLAESLSALSKQVQDMGLQLPQLDDAIKDLAANQTDMFLKDLQAATTDLEKMRDMAKQLAQLQQQVEKLGKDLAEQLKNGQPEAAQQTLQKMITQLNASNLTPEQLQKLMQEVSKAIPPAGNYGELSKHLKSASKQMQSGDKSAAAGSLASASKELDKLMQQMGDAQQAQATLDALKEASMAIGTGQGWRYSRQPGQGEPGQNGEPGRGVGTWADDNAQWDGRWSDGWDNSGITQQELDARGHSERDADLNQNLSPTKVRGQFSPGGQMPSITLKGVSIKGQSKLAYEEAAAAAQSDAQSALSQEKVPRAYQGAVKDYFDDLKK